MFVDARLHLNRGVLDAEAVLELGGDLVQEGVALVAARHHQMRRKRGLGSAHRPDVQVMDGVTEVVVDKDVVDGRKEPVRVVAGDGKKKEAAA